MRFILITVTLLMAHAATTASTGMTEARLPRRRPMSAVIANPAIGSAGMRGTSSSIVGTGPAYCRIVSYSSTSGVRRLR